MSLGISASDFTATLADLGASVTYRKFNGSKDQYGGTVYSFATDITKTWIFFKRSSRTDLIKWGISEVGDAYVLMATTDSLNYNDRLVVDGEIFEFTNDCIFATRTVAGIALYKYYTLKKVGES